MQPNRAFMAEQAVIGAILLDEMVVSIAREILEPSDFFTKANEEIFRAMVTLSDAGQNITLASLLVKLSGNQQFEHAGGIQYLVQCQNQIIYANTIESDAKLVRDDSIRRKLSSFADSIKAIAESDVADVNQTISSLSNELMSLAKTNAVTPWIPFSKSIESACESLINDSDENLVKSGFIDLDAKLTGFKPGSLNIIAARPAMGKTALGLNIAANAAIDARLPVAFFSLEMTADELTNRVISSRALVNGNAIRRKKFSDKEWERILSATERLHDAKILIDETPGIDIAVLCDRARRMQVQNGIKLLVVDYIQLMTCGARKVQNREQEIATISRGLKGLAKELHIPIIALAQLNRAVETRSEKRPLLSDLRESGSMEQDADCVMFIHREDYYQPNAEPTNEAEIIISKQRNGPTGVIKLHWSGEFTLFSNLDRDTEF